MIRKQKYTLKDKLSLFNSLKIITMLSVIFLGSIVIVSGIFTIMTPTSVLSYDVGLGEVVNSSYISPAKYAKDKTVRLPTDDIFENNDNYVFEGWYLHTDSSQNIITSVPMENDKHLIAKWIKVTYEETVEQTDVSYKIVKVEDDTLEIGQEVVSVSGSQGLKETLSNQKLHDGIPVGLPDVREKIVTDAVDEIVLVGTKVLENVTMVPKEKPLSSKPETKPVPKPESESNAKPPTNTSKPSGNYTPTHGVGLVVNPYNDIFPNCKELNTYYPTGVPKGHPAYALARDRDRDDWACERK